AFGPHAVLVRLQGDKSQATADTAAVQFVRCSALLSEDSTAFRLDSWPSCELRVNHCLFSYPGGDGTSFTTAEAMGKALGHGPALIRQTGPCKLCYLGDDNRYHHLQALWSRPADKVFLTSLADFQKVVEGGDGQDQRSVVLTANPWKNADPL